jgi:hypothetical protein
MPSVREDRLVRRAMRHDDYSRYHDAGARSLKDVLAVQESGEKAAATALIDRWDAWDDSLHPGIAARIREQQRFRFRLFECAALANYALQMIDSACQIRGAEAVVDVHHCQAAGAGVEHAQQRRDTLVAGAVADARRHRDHWHLD